MRNLLRTFILALCLAGAAQMAIPTAAVAQDGDIGGGDDGGVVSVFKKADGKKFKFPLRGYVTAGIFCSAATNIADSVITGMAEQRQLTPKKALANAIGCFTFGLGGYVYLALNPESLADIYAARVARLYDQLPARREQFFADVIGDRKALSYPPVAQMLRELRAAGIRVKKLPTGQRP